MIYKKYGETFRQMRIQAEFSLSSFSVIGIPKSTLSNFELGYSMMSFDKVVLALQLIGSSLSDFENNLNNYGLSDSDALAEEILYAYIRDDTTSLKDLKEITKISEYSYLEICIKVILNEATQDEIETVVDFLYKIHIWSYKELFILYIMLDDIKWKDILNILRNLKSTGQELYNSDMYKGYLAHVLYRAVTSLCLKGDKIRSQSILNSIVYYDLANTMTLQNLLKAINGFWLYCFEDKKLGKQMILEFLDIQHLVGQDDFSKYYNKRFFYLIDQIDNQVEEQ
ncbi:Rgg/GadR/MutR family transcriptional regulator [Lactococcus garvieae]|uniref:Rgg/GadR/MutR family transcriptional regulator n=1 Tax=Lactococcus garvieae TaxID=1363 RepID=UPI0038548DA8